MAETTKTINSDAFVGQESLQTINSDSVILVTSEQTIKSSSVILAPFIVAAETDLTLPGTEEMDVETELDNPVPSAPTSLVAQDLQKGDVVRLTWSSTAPFFNVYKKEAGPTYTKLNPNILEGVNTYDAGGLEPDVAVTFIVRGVNGLGQESVDSNEATATPTFPDDIDRFRTFTAVVKIDGSPVEDAILETVQLGFGSNFSTAVFTLPRDIRLANPVVDSAIDVVVNGKLLFRGTAVSKNDIVNESGGLRVAYTCYSSIIDLTKDTICSKDVDGTISRFNTLEIGPERKASLQNEATAAQILSQLGVSGGPSSFPGHVDITDLTKLSAAELVASKIGNYKLYHDMETGITSVYQFGGGGFGVREFEFGKNIVDYNVTESSIDTVNRIEVVGASVTKRVRKGAADLTKAVDSDGRLAMSFELGGKNIRDIQVFGFVREKPVAVFDESIQVTLKDLSGPFDSDSLIDNSFSLSSSFFNAQTDNEIAEDERLRPILLSLAHYSTVEQPIGAKVEYSDKDSARVFLSEVPKRWIAITKSGDVPRSKVGLEGEGDIRVRVLLDYQFAVGGISVEYTVDDDPPVVTAGSGLPSRCITDGQYAIVDDGVTGFNNEDQILSEMNARAANELNRLKGNTISGSVTVIGDETIDLRSSVRIEDELLQIGSITHDFTNGFLTRISLTNESFFRNIIVRPSLEINQPREREQNKRRIFENFETREIAEARKEIQSQKDRTEKNAPGSGPFAIYQD